MKKYVIRRILSGILTIFIVFTLTFILIKSAPGDPIRTLLGQDNDDPVLQAALKEDDQQQDHQAEASEEELPVTGNGAKHFLNLCHA